MDVTVSRYETNARGETGTGVLWVEYLNRFSSRASGDRHEREGESSKLSPSKNHFIT